MFLLIHSPDLSALMLLKINTAHSILHIQDTGAQDFQLSMAILAGSYPRSLLFHLKVCTTELDDVEQG